MYWFVILSVVVVINLLLARRNTVARTKFMVQSVSKNGASAVSDAVKGLLKKGRKIEAIKQFRTETGLCLKDAKDILDAVDVSKSDGVV